MLDEGKRAEEIELQTAFRVLQSRIDVGFRSAITVLKFFICLIKWNQLEGHLHSSLRLRHTELIFFLTVEDVEPEAISNGEVLLFDLHLCLHRFSLSFDCLLDDPMDFVEIDPCLSYQVVVSNEVSIPNLNSEDVRVHIFWLWRVVDWELEPVIEVSDRSASPMGVSLLRLSCSDSCPHVDIIRFHLHILIDAFICLPHNDSELEFVKRRRCNRVCWSIEPLLLLNQINEGLDSAL